jgi:hypothetical protein
MDVRRLVLAAAALLLLAGCASGGSRHAAAGRNSSPTGSSMSTAVRTFDPYTASGRLTVLVRQRVRGHCWEISLAAPAPDTYRCLAGNRILDPCFAPPTGAAKTLACFADPWSKAVVLAVHRLPKAPPVATRPWAVVLGNGKRCVAATGTAPFVAGVGLDYSCGGGTAAALRNVSGKRVTALVGSVGGSTLRRTSVRTIWRG